MVFAILLATPDKAEAQPFASGMITLRDAINGNGAALSLIAADLATGGAFTDPAAYVAVIEAALGGNASANALINNALALDNAANSAIHGAFPGLYMYNYFPNLDPYFGTPLPATENVHDDLLNTIIAGTSNHGLHVLRMAYQGYGNTQNLLNELLDGRATNPFSAPAAARVESLSGNAPATIQTLNFVNYAAIGGAPLVGNVPGLADGDTFTVNVPSATVNPTTITITAATTIASLISDMEAIVNAGAVSVLDVSLSGTKLVITATNIADTITLAEGIGGPLGEIGWGSGVFSPYTTLNYSAITTLVGTIPGLVAGDSFDISVTGATVNPTTITITPATTVASLRAQLQSIVNATGTRLLNVTVTGGKLVMVATNLTATITLAENVGQALTEIGWAPGVYAPATGSTGLDLLRTGATATTTAEMITLLTDAINGDNIALDKIRISLFNIVTYSSGILDATAIGYLNRLLASLGSAPPLVDTDGDGIPDINDLDDDNDGIPDYLDSDDDGDGVTDDAIRDTDGDGIPDNVDTDDDNDGIPDVTDDDDDGDGIPDAEDPDRDTDGDGTPDIFDTDDDNDGIDDTADSDQDGDGIDNTVDNDSSISISDSDGTNSCGTENAELTGSFAEDPCQTTTDNRSLTFSQNYQGGEQIFNHLQQWWNNDFLPAMKDQTTQLNSSVLDQTRQIGSMMDATVVGSAMRVQKEAALENKIELTPNELTCAAGSQAPALAFSSQGAKAISNAVKNDMSKRSRGASGSPSASGSLADTKARYEEYCAKFNNPDANNGVNACSSPATPGAIVDGDIDVEGMLFRDSIKLDDIDQYGAIMMMLGNMIEPRVFGKLPDEVVDTPAGVEWILKKEHISSIRNLAADVVTSIVSKRASLPIDEMIVTPPPPPAPPAPPAPGAPLPTSGNYDAFINALGMRESGGNYTIRGGAGNNYLGKYQFGEYALAEIGCIQNEKPACGKGRGHPCIGDNNCCNATPYQWNGTCGGVGGINSYTDYLNSPAAQDGAVRAHNSSLIAQMRARGMDRFFCTTVNGVVVTPSGMIAAAHLVGAGALNMFLKSGGARQAADAFGTKATDYLDLFKNYESPFGPTCPNAGAPIPPPAGDPGQPSEPADPKTVCETIKEIRLKAGVDPAQITCSPSYNEIMLAMTKERFFDPEYFLRLANNAGALKQEQTAINAYITLQMQDIYTLQEQINALLAARASMILGKETPSRIESAPQR